MTFLFLHGHGIRDNATSFAAQALSTTLVKILHIFLLILGFWRPGKLDLPTTAIPEYRVSYNVNAASRSPLLSSAERPS
ncbi:hypothetical protein N7448_005896 [Penicillium atrosanguineum]|uniref:Uncharacterized protein n=1 Tax=Penicillium atrosanguineum TaxID=1132637 RepID=A0A9W9GXL6_9EURO|nr:DASH complex subunit DAD2 [Penicillium atrosanguineum]KAJ5131738.1 hypothetical protein N7448_005896 [Penicillium atrosanguineum]KAJ5138056.1 hypothetical protein N7526_004289 [Penicillium atrosanguineum]KAJ5289407.1 DASH complex subunit DAD2 [Penicillium atrosanguineum]KAJ5307222.1 hypothetical protein N7476_007878 [Penicillium atrosanguineum]